MNKISKKIVALVTMAAFVLTLVPAAAFADVKSGVDLDKSSVEFTQSVANKVNVKFNFNNDQGQPVSGTAADNVTISVTGAKGAETLDVVDAVDTSAGKTGSAISYNGSGNVQNGYEFTVKFDNPGTYDIEVTTTDASGQKVVLGSVNDLYVWGNATPGASYLTTEDGTAITVDPDTTKDIEFAIMDGTQTVAKDGLSNVYVWAENEDGYLSDAVVFSGLNGAYGTGSSNQNASIFKINRPVKNGQAIKAEFKYPGTYTIYAATATSWATGGNTATKAEDALKALNPFNAGVKVTINARNYVTKTIDVNTVDSNPVTTVDTNEYTYTINDGVTPNGVKVYEVEGQALQSNGTPAQYETLNISCVKSDLKLLDTEVGTDANGEFSFRFTIVEPGSYNIKIAESNGEATAELKVVDQTAAPLTIKTTEQGGTLLAGNDAYYADNAYGLMDDAVQFAITDVYDNEADSAAVLANEEAATTGGDHADYLSVTAPKDSTLKADDLVLAWSEGNVFTLNYVNADATGGPAKDLIPGEYTVTVSLNNGKTATATFNIAKFGTVKDITTELEATAGWPNNNNNAITTIDDEVALGQTITGTAYLVDENGIKVKADEDELNIGINGSNSASVIAKDEQHNPFSFTLANNTAANESLIGSTVTVKVFDETHKKYVEKTLTIVKGYLAETLSFDPTEGPINEDNSVAVSVVDENDKLSKVNGHLYAYIEKQSNADAKVELDIANDTVSNGKGELTLYSDQEGTVDVVVVVKAANGEMYGKTLTYTFGAVDPAAQNTVVMTIGSTDYVVNNDIISGDAAPYVDSNWRTMVPFRVLGETFGATVDWDQENKTVTYTYGNTTLTMTIDSTTYTVNGEEKTMDTAPVLNGDRTYVPVRFVAEALGYEVTPLQDSTGLTASVVFQK